jgi:hypothetical protein
MAITTNSSASVIRPPVEGDWKFVSVYSADLSDAEDIIAATTGKKHYIRKIQVFAQSVADVTITFGAAQTSSVTTIYLGPLSLADAGGSILIDFGPDHALQVAVGTAFSVDMSAACPTAILVWYKTAD